MQNIWQVRWPCISTHDLLLKMAFFSGVWLFHPEHTRHSCYSLFHLVFVSMHERKTSCKSACTSLLEAEKMGAQSFLHRDLKLAIYVIHFCRMPTHLLIKLKPFLDQTCCTLSEGPVFLFSPATLSIPAHYLITNQ